MSQISCSSDNPEPIVIDTTTVVVSPDKKDGLITFFNFNEGGGGLLIDYSGNNYHGKINGISNSGWVLGVSPNENTIDRAIDLGYTSRFIELSFTNTISSQFSMSIWVKPLLLDKSETLMSIFESSQDGGPNFCIRNDGAVVFWLKGKDNNSKKVIYSSRLLQENKWQHIAITYNKSSGVANIFVSGTLTGTDILDKQDVLINNKSVIGGSGSNGFFDGIIDNLLIYGHVLSDQEITALSNKFLPDKVYPTYTDYQKSLKDTSPTPTLGVSTRDSYIFSGTDFPPNPIEKNGWELTKYDEFNGTQLDENLWIPFYLRQRATDSQALAEYEFRDGCIVLKISKDKINYYSTNKISSLQTAEGTNFHVKGSREIAKKINFAQKYGYFEIRAKTQIGSGQLCAFWLVGATNDLTKNGEIDIFEQPGNAGVNSFLFNLYKWDDIYLDLPVNSRGWQNRLRSNRNLTNTFNIYGLEWDENEIKLYLNNELMNIIPKSPAYEMAVLISLYEIDGDWFGDLDKNIPYPKEFAIDYFRVYKKLQ